MPKLPQCDRCLLYARNPHLICAVHPTGPTADTCLDFREDPNTAPDELWEPEGVSYYNGELIPQPRLRWTAAEQLELLDAHPLFTGRCPQCSHPFPKYEIPRCIGIVRSADGWTIRCEAIASEAVSLNYQLRQNVRSTPHLTVQPTNPPANTTNAH
ncbi:hypothetical protein K4039_08510 [Lyngbya sp. CCAP 1446/10]|uniref:hypothetical protein n=1 Tax=Lyngbya sp. CCAP 1446/10 TaxID=439293 RepID=UPI002238BEC1|nr:hypothetical protein [Lyngbya sp. CCAP 1446/10]MCW6050122.1 hypothetical protein [Lyngbya sp. CCAP 1446/10]